MILLEPDRTPYDLNWRMFGIHVRVHPLFWLIAAMLGWGLVKVSFAYLLVWIGCVFVSVLVHEMGHVFMGRVFGTRGHIILYSFGGLAVGSSNLSNRWQRIAVYFAGPLAGFLLYGLFLSVPIFFDLEETPPLVRGAVGHLIKINLAWGILNLIPIFPLDGGQISRDFLSWLMPRNGLRISLGLSVGIAGLFAVWGIMERSIFTAILFGMLAFSSFQLLQQLPSRRQYWDEDRSSSRERKPWENDPDDWKR